MFRIVVFVWLSLCVVAGKAHAQADYPSKPVKIIVPSAPGGGTDIAARVLAQALSQIDGPAVLHREPPRRRQHDRHRGGGTLGARWLHAADDREHAHHQPPHLQEGAVRCGRDFAPISNVVSLPSVLVVHPSVEARTLAEFVALAKRKPGELTYASAGAGSNPHFAMELLKTMAGIDIRHIPYKGVGPGLNDVLSGQVSSMIAGVLSTRPLVEAGKLRGLAASSLARIESLPDIPTISEAGVPNYELMQWYGLLAPAGTPAPIIQRLYAETAKAARGDEMKARLATDGAIPVGNTPAEFAAHIKQEMAKWGEVARAAKIEPQ